jgi:hypothetical protein
MVLLKTNVTATEKKKTDAPDNWETNITNILVAPNSFVTEN